jgi:peptidoglycan/xylan/chitin deacetylase (PgdA/CDA1 family)
LNDHRPTCVRIAVWLLISTGALCPASATAQDMIRQATAPEALEAPAVRKPPEAPTALPATTRPASPPSQECSTANALGKVLGVSRELQVGSEAAAGVGLKTYAQTLALQDHEVVLTFDDGPSPTTTKQVLDALRSECVKATFFLIGRNAEAYPDLVKREIREGHTVGSHSWSHPAATLRGLSESAARTEITKGMAAVDQAGWGEPGPDGKPHVPFFRFPGFADTGSTLKFLKEQGVAVFGTDIWAEDWVPMSPQAQLRFVLTRLERAGRGIILLHDIHPQTVAMLPDFLRALKAGGYKVVHLVPAAGEFQTNKISAGWTSETEPIVERVLSRGVHARSALYVRRHWTCSRHGGCNRRVRGHGLRTNSAIRLSRHL